MNRNVESHFSENPINLDISRSQFDRSSRTIFSGNVGDIIPFYVDEVLPGDTFNVETSKVVRMQTLLKPIMDDMYLDTYFFFCPYRLVWDHWKNFMGESNQAWTPSVTYTIPQLSIGSTRSTGDLMDYMGLSPNVKNVKVSALPFRCYAKVMSDWFYDQNLSTPLVLSTGDADTSSGSISDAQIYVERGGPCYKASKYHDYFTSCLPAPQKGPAVTVPLNDGGTIPIYTRGDNHSVVYPGASAFPLTFRSIMPDGTLGTPREVLYEETNSNVKAESYGTWSAGTLASIVPDNLFFDGNSAYFDVNSLRQAFQVQKFYEKCARGGTRYIETIKAQFGVTSPDGRLQRSEYLGGNRIPLTVHEVTNNAESSGNVLGNVGGMSRTVDSDESFVKSFTEHGLLLGVCVVRYKHTYGQGIDRMFSRKTIFDHYWPVFANLGEQAVMQKEIYYDSANPNLSTVFGYQEAWAEYRYKQDRVAGEMRPDVTGNLASWHLADNYAAAPSISVGWIRADLNNVDRVLAVTSSVADQYFADIYVKNICTRAMPMYSIPGLIDHH